MLCIYRHQVGWNSWGRDLLWGLTSVGARNCLLHTHLDWPWGPPSVLTMGTGVVTLVWCWSQLLASFCHSFAWNTSVPSGNIFMRFDNEVFFLKLSKKKSSLIKWWITDTLCQDLCTFIMVSSCIFPVGNVWYRSFRKNRNEHFMFNYIFLKIVLFYVTVWKNVESDHRWQYDMVHVLVCCIN